MYEYIDTSEKLQVFIERIANASWVALDTEFMRDNHYFSRLCLIQVATEEHIACIDPLACDDLSAFATILYDTNITKVLHAAHQDFDIFYQLFKKIPTPLFDTQIAAAVLGIGEQTQMGYSNLVKHILAVELDKSQSRTNWQQRPLSAKQLDYAIDDVRYLRQLYPLLVKQLQQLDRFAWLEPSFAHSTALSTYQTQFDKLWKKVRGKQKLDGQQLAVLRELTIWREKVAIKRDLPRRWVVKDSLLIHLARFQPNSINGIRRLRAASTKQLKPYHQIWLKLIKKAQQIPEAEWPVMKAYKKPNKTQVKKIELLQLAVRYYAEKHNISTTLIANRKTLEKMVLEERNTLSDDWRGDLVNDSFAALLAGEMKISVDQQDRVILNHHT